MMENKATDPDPLPLLWRGLGGVVSAEREEWMKVFGLLVKFHGNDYSTYNYKCTIEGVQKGDLVVVEAKDDYAMARVIDVFEEAPPAATRWAFQKVDLTALNAMKDRVKEAKRLKGLLEQKLRKALEADKYRALAEKDPEVADAIKALEALGEL